MCIAERYIPYKEHGIKAEQSATELIDLAEEAKTKAIGLGHAAFFTGFVAIILSKDSHALAHAFTVLPALSASFCIERGLTSRDLYREASAE